MVLNSNIAVLNSLETSRESKKQLDNSTAKLASGLRINKSSDDGSGLAVADKLRTQTSSMSQSIANGNSAIALLELADKSMGEQSNILDVIKGKLVQAKTATTSDEGRAMIQGDIRSLLEQVDNIGINTHYNGTYLLVERERDTRDLTYSDVGAIEGIKFHLGEFAEDTVRGPIGVKATSDGLALDGLFSTELTAQTSGDYMSIVDDAIDTLNNWRAEYGAVRNQVESSVKNMMTRKTDLQAAESTIRDVDYAKESADFSTKNILSQTGSFTISQANNIKSNMLNSLQ